MTQKLNILVTGASRGIGAGILAAFSGHRAVGHSSRGSENLIAADLAQPGAAAGLWEEAVERLGGRIDVLVNNAGIFEAAPIDLAPEAWAAQWERTMRVNLIAAAELCRLAVRHYRERGDGGRIVNVASRAAYRGDSPDHWHYAAAKAGMVAMTKTIARGYAGEGIFAFTVCPGFTVTGMVEEYVASRGGRAGCRRARPGRRRRAGVGDGRGDRRQRGELCPVILSCICRGVGPRGEAAW